MLKGFVIVLVLMPFSNKKSTIDLQRKYVYKVLLCILKRSCPRTFGLLFDLCSFVPKHLASQYLYLQVMQFGRIDNNAYTLDFQYPFTAVQAFAVALANVTQRLK